MESGANERLGSNTGWRRRGWSSWVSAEECGVERNVRSWLGWMVGRQSGWWEVDRTRVWQWRRGSGADNGWSRSGHTPHWSLVGGDVVWHWSGDKVGWHWSGGDIVEMMVDLVDNPGRQSLDHKRPGAMMMRESCGRNCWHCWTYDWERLDWLQWANTR